MMYILVSRCIIFGKFLNSLKVMIVRRFPLYIYLLWSVVNIYQLLEFLLSFTIFSLWWESNTFYSWYQCRIGKFHKRGQNDPEGVELSHSTSAPVYYAPAPNVKKHKQKCIEIKRHSDYLIMTHYCICNCNPVKWNWLIEVTTIHISPMLPFTAAIAIFKH